MESQNIFTWRIYFFQIFWSVSSHLKSFGTISCPFYLSRYNIVICCHSITSRSVPRFILWSPFSFLSRDYPLGFNEFGWGWGITTLKLLWLWYRKTYEEDIKIHISQNKNILNSFLQKSWKSVCVVGSEHQVSCAGSEKWTLWRGVNLQTRFYRAGLLNFQLR